ncbi:hypothetical protein I600_3866 [Maribacter dokdonensis DSW-8]|nr:hypothetical protein I600_3866 [Maribacter dokdonensis DSW-8]
MFYTIVKNTAMQKVSFTENLDFNDKKMVTQVLLETSFS